MRRKSPLSENILYLIENHCQTNISKGRRGKSLNLQGDRDDAKEITAF